MGWKKNLTATVIIGGVATGILHVINRLVYYISTIDNLLSQKDENYYDWRFGRIFYSKKGSGTPILLIHDLNVTSSAYEWNKIVDSLSETNTVYALDLLGCGRSDKPNLIYTNYLYVQMITDFIKNVIGDKTDVIATGESGTFVLLASANDKSIINKIMLVNPQNLAQLAKIPTNRSKMLRYFINLPILGTFIYNICINKRIIEKNFRSKYYYDINNIEERSIITYFESLHRGNTHSKYLFASIKSRYTNANILYCLKEFTNSIFVIVGNSNPENALIANQYQNYLPSIEIVGIDNTKYLPQMEKSSEFVEQVKILFEIDSNDLTA